MERKLIDKSIYRRLPDELKVLTENFDEREKDIVLLSSLGVLSNCLPNVYGIYDGDEIYPNLYAIIIAPPASGKGVMNYSRLLIQPIHDQILNESQNEIALFNKKDKDKNSKEISPQIKIKILPANVSTAEMYSFLGTSSHGLLIMESEADTMSNMLKNDWSNYSDVLRKAFHHEPISLSRKMDKVFEDIKEPKLSMVISGTPDQLLPLIKSRENGLYSRFMVYNFDELSDFKDVFAKKLRDNKKNFTEIGSEILELYNKLIKRESPLEFGFTDAQKMKFRQRFKVLRSDIIEENAESFIPNLHRHGLIFFRIAMILTAIRNKAELDSLSNLECSNSDFMTAMYLTKALLKHSQYTYNSLDYSYLSKQDEELLDALSTRFSREDAIKAGEVIKIPKRTIDDKLAQWHKKKLIKRFKLGIYDKL